MLEFTTHSNMCSHKIRLFSDLWITSAAIFRRLYAVAMRARQFIPVLILGILLLPACVPQPVAQPPEPAPSATPVFASEEEALAAAVAAYEAYLKASDEIAADGGAHPERLKDLVTEEWYEKEVEGFEQFAASGLRASGRTVMENVQIQSYVAFPEIGSEAVWIYLCSDVSGVDVLNDEGTSVVSPDRPERTSFEVGLVLQAHRLLISSRNVWDSGNVCN